MKILIMILITSSAMASNWVPLSKIQLQSPQAYQLESECLKTGEQCLDIGDEPQALSLGFVSLEDNYIKADTDDCSDEQDCTARFDVLVCSQNDWQKIKNIELLQVYCVKLAGKKLVKDVAGFNAYKASEVYKSQINQIIANGAKADADCKKVLHLIGGFNLLPGRSSDQASEMVASFAQAKAFLQDGRPGAAKVAIQAIPVDGVLVTQAMKDLALDILKDW